MQFKIPITDKQSWSKFQAPANDGDTEYPEEEVYVPGDRLGMFSGEFLKGHGVYTSNDKGELVANVGGEMKRVDQVVSVTPIWARYIGDVGDIVVGRIVVVAQKKWYVELNALQDATLHLTAVNLPSGQQRRRTAADELLMRDFFEEGDLLVAEVQNVYHDGSMSLHTRTNKFGRLRGGTLVQVAPGLIKRLEQHIIALPELQAELVIGLNGYIWVSAMDKSNSPKCREIVAIVRNAIVVLKSRQRTISPDSILEIAKQFKGKTAKGAVVDHTFCVS